MSRYRLDRAAICDLESIHDYIARSTKESAERLLRRIAQVLKTLAKNPLSGECRPEIAANLRSFSCGNYVIYFRRPMMGSRSLAYCTRHETFALQWDCRQSKHTNRLLLSARVNSRKPAQPVANRASYARLSKNFLAVMYSFVG